MNPEIVFKPMTTAELEQSKVITALEMWFVHNSSADVIRDRAGTLLSRLVSVHSSRVKFVIAQHLRDRLVTLGIFYPEQTAAVSAHALRDFLNWKLNSLELARQNDLLSYWPDRTRRPLQQSPIEGDIAIIGGWEIYADASRDVSSSMTLEDNFWTAAVSLSHMEIVRRLVLEKLGIES